MNWKSEARPSPRRSATGRSKKKAQSGAFYVAMFTVLATLLRLVNSIVFSHMFVPEYFGLLALVTTIIVGLTLFSQPWRCRIAWCRTRVGS